MFSKTTYCALLMMMESANAYCNGEGVDIDFVSRKHAIPMEAFDEVARKLSEKKLILVVDGKLYLQIHPDHISIWQIITDVAGDCIFSGRYFNKDKPVTPTPMAIMLDKESERYRSIIGDRLKRVKLSTWSEKANNIIYI